MAIELSISAFERNAKNFNKKGLRRQFYSIYTHSNEYVSALPLAASTKYKLTAGGTSYIFTTPPNTTYSDATTSAHGLMTAADKTKLNALVNLGLTLVGSV